jgi:hypothetical protein
MHVEPLTGILDHLPAARNCLTRIDAVTVNTRAPDPQLIRRELPADRRNRIARSLHSAYGARCAWGRPVRLTALKVTSESVLGLRALQEVVGSESLNRLHFLGLPELLGRFLRCHEFSPSVELPPRGQLRTYIGKSGAKCPAQRADNLSPFGMWTMQWPRSLDVPKPSRE